MLAPVSQASATAAPASEVRAPSLAPSIEAGAKAALAATAGTRPLPAPSLDSASIDQLQRLILSAGAGGQGLLGSLADLVARSLKIERKPGETSEAFFLRIAETIDRLGLAERLVTEMKTGLKALAITLPDLARALREPAGAQAARLVAQAEAMAQAARPAPSEAATHSYLDDGAGPQRPAETLQARFAAAASAGGQNLFSPHVEARTAQPAADARLIQSVLSQAYEDNAATLGAEPAQTSAREPARATQAMAERTATALPAGPDAEPMAQAATPPQTLGGALRALAASLAEPARPASAAVVGDPGLPEAKTPETRPAAQPERRQTMMILRGLTEVVSQLAEKAAEAVTFRQVVEDIPAPDAEPAETAPGRPVLPLPAPAAAFGPGSPVSAEAAGIANGKTMPDGDIGDPEQALLEAVIEDADEDAVSGTQRKASEEAEGGIRQPGDAEEREAIRQAFKEPVPIGFAAIPYPIEDEPEDAPRRKATGQQEPGDEPAEDEADEQPSPEDEGKRERERLDAMLAPDTEDEAAPLGRTATDADRAFRHYQRMSGF